MDDLFPGEARPIPATSGTGFVVFGPADDADLPLDAREALRGPVTHGAGYLPFTEAVAEAGADPVRLAQDLAALVEALAAHRGLLEDPDLADAAAVFLGNAIIAARPGSSWARGRVREVRSESGSVEVDRLVRLLADDAGLRRGFLEAVPSWAAEDERQRRRQQLVEAAMAGEPPTGEAPPHVRPWIDGRPFRDDEGRPYGERWPGSPPEDAYSRVTRPERFAPLLQVADALVAHLMREYDVATSDERAADGTGIVRFVPPTGAPLTLECTDFPGLRLEAGAAFAATVPSCGCDACDETWQGGADALEESVLAIVAGGLTEYAQDGGVVHGLRHRGGASGGSGDVAPRTPPPDGPWPPWPLRRP